MKRFLRSIPGKTLLFLLCSLSIIAAAGSALAAAFFYDYGLYFQTEQYSADKYIEREMQSRAGYFLHLALNGGNSDINENFCWRLTDNDTKKETLSSSAGKYADSFTRSYEFTEDQKRYFDEGKAKYTLEISLKEDLPIRDDISLGVKAIRFCYRARYAVLYIAPAAAVLSVLLFVALMSVSGRRPGDDELHMGPLNRLPFDIMLLPNLVYLILGIEIFGSGINYGGLIVLGVFTLIEIAVFLGTCMSAAARLKEGTLFSNTVFWRCIQLIWKILCFFGRQLSKFARAMGEFLRDLPLVWKTVLLLLGVGLSELFALYVGVYSYPNLATLWFFSRLIVFPAILYVAVLMRRLQKSGERLAKGDLGCRTDTKGMFLDFKKHGENLNGIAGAISAAVDERMKSERMKTELITNVSHDIKTPLTSIINYSELISKEKTENEKIIEYSQVLSRQSDKLKRLIEDLVEASKAQTGSLEIINAPCDAATFVTQAAGEYQERLDAAGLSLVVRVPEEKLTVMADGRRMMRIFDNLMNNIEKYALDGTRVYLTLEKVGRFALFSFKNTSREPLDMTEEELMERFTRGDESRHTDGNGLGLSIAKSIAELMDGSLRIEIDGDLFKALLSFPVV
ncbi:MAG: HAMP domain-containing histidine kinase [Clostridiales bacterium]|nr:HAMP domain-containing histidine kinase [Clostridiales bacterium]